MANPFDQFDEPAKPAGNPFDQFDAPRGSAGAAPEPVTAVDVPAGAGGRQPLKVDVNALPESLRTPDGGAFFRGALDELTSSSGDELTAAIKSVLGDQGYENYVNQERTLRAIDAVASPKERGSGQFLGLAGSALLPVGPLLESANVFGRVAKGIGFGAGLSGANAIGEAQDMSEAADNLPGAMVGGGLTGGTVAAAPMVASGLYKTGRALFGNGTAGAISALEQLGVTPAELRAAYAAMEKTLGRKPSLAEVIGPEGKRLRPALAADLKASPTAQKALSTAEEQLQQGILARAEPKARAAQDMFDNAERRGDIEFARFRDVPVQLPNTYQVFLKNNVLETPGALGALKANDADRIKEAIANGTIMGGDLDLLRRGLRKLNRTDLGTTYETLAGQVEDIISDAIPAASRAVKNYARRMTRAEGVEKVGEKALSSSSLDFTSARNRPQLSAPTNLSPQDQALFDTLPAKDRGKLARQGGTRVGTYNAIASAAKKSTTASYEFARSVEGNTSAADNVRLSLGKAKGDELIAYVTAQKKAIDNLSELSGIPVEAVATAADAVRESAKAGAVGLKGGGAAIVASLASDLVLATGIGRGPAQKLTEMLFEPGQFERAVSLLEKRGVKYPQIGAFFRNALQRAGADLGKDNTRAPDGVVVTGQPLQPQ